MKNEITKLGRKLSKTSATGAAAISASTSALSGAFRLVSVTVKLSTAPTTSQSLTITLNANDGAAYDTVLATRDLVGVTSYVFMPDSDIFLEDGDSIDLAYTNTDTRTYGAQITLEAVS